MKVMTVRQPWAWAIVRGGKDVENRSRNIAGSYRGPVAIHVGLREDVNAFSDQKSSSLPALNTAVDRWIDGLTAKQSQRGYTAPWHTGFGAIIGVVDLVDVHHYFNALTDFEGCSPWAEIDAWHLVLENARSLVAPIQFKGALGMRDLPADIESLIRAGVVS